MKCCNGNGWYMSYSGGFAHPVPCERCNPEGALTFRPGRERPEPALRAETRETAAQCEASQSGPPKEGNAR